jgi:glycosyltransferase involved in cell wall biosynthesis
MRLLLVSHSWNDPNAGASRVYHQLSEGLRNRGHEVHCLHRDDVSIPRLVAPVASRLWLPTCMSRRASRESLRTFDVIMASNGMLHPLFRRLKRAKAAALLVNHVHGLSYFDYQATVTERLRGNISSSYLHRWVTGALPARWDILGSSVADLTVVQNDRDLDFLAERGVDPIVKIPLAVHPEIVEAAKSIPDPGARSPLRLLWFGSWVARKGAHYLPRAFELIVDRCPVAHLTVGGTGLPAEWLRTYFKPSLWPRIDFLPRISVEEQIALFGRSSVFLFPSISEGFGYALLEAMSLGLAVVTTQTGIGGDYLRDGETASIVPSGSSLHLANAAVRLMEDSHLRCSLAKNGQALSRNFSVERYTNEYAETFEEYQARKLHSLTGAKGQMSRAPAG